MLLQALYFALPIYLANMAPLLVKRLPWLKQPIDGGRIFKGQRVLGDHKTWRGLFSGILLGALTGLLQSVLFENVPSLAEISVVEYTPQFSILLGGLMGFGALFGDAAKSFFKRRSGRPSGSSWPLFDQLDFIAGGLLFSLLLVRPSLDIVLILFFITPILHLLMNIVSHAIGLKDVPW